MGSKMYNLKMCTLGFHYDFKLYVIIENCSIRENRIDERDTWDGIYDSEVISVFWLGLGGELFYQPVWLGTKKLSKNRSS